MLTGSLLVGITVMLTLSTVSPIFAQDAENTENKKLLTGVAKEYDENNIGFDIEYELKGELSNVVLVNSTENYVTFEYDSQGILEDELTIYLPVELIDEIQFTQVDGEREPESIRFKLGNITQMTVPLNQNNKEINFVGAKVIPEFGSITVFILLISIISIIVLTSTKKFQINLVR